MPGSTHEFGTGQRARTEVEVVARAPSGPKEMGTEAADLPVRQYNQWGLVWRRFTRHRMAVVGACLILLMVALALLGPLVSPGFVPFIPAIGGPPLWAHAQQNIGPHVWPPQWRFLMGTDAQANPVISYVLEGGRPLLLIGFAGALIASLVGAAIGSLAGYLGGFVDAVLMRIVDAFLAVPFVLLLVLFSQQLTDRGPLLYAIMFGLLGWPGVARLVRGYILSLREREFAEAARALGATSWGIILRHLLPNALDVLVVSFTLNIAVFLVTEVTLDYLGAGTFSTTWGTPLSGAFAGLINDNWWVGTFPAIPIIVTALGFNFLGDGLRDALDTTSATALFTSTQAYRSRRTGPVRSHLAAMVRVIAVAWGSLTGTVAVARRRATATAQSLPGIDRVRAAAEPQVQDNSRAPLSARLAPPILVTIAVGVAILYGHSPLIYSPNYNSPTPFASLRDAAEFGAVPAAIGAWNILAVDNHSQLVYQRIDARGRHSSARVLGAGDDNSQPALAMIGSRGLGAWVGQGGTTVYAARLGDGVSRPFALNPGGGTVQNPTVVAVRGSYAVLFGWQRPGAYGGFDIYLARVPGDSGRPHLVRLVRSGDYALYPKAAVDGMGALDTMYLRRFSPGQYDLIFQRFRLDGASISRPQTLGVMNYVLPGSNGCSLPSAQPPTQWALDVKRSSDGSVWAAWATGVDCLTRGGISGSNVLSVGHWSPTGKILLPPTSIDPNLDASGQTVALATQGTGEVAYYPRPGTDISYLAATRIGATGAVSIPQRVSYEGGGNAANVRAGAVGDRPAVMWERSRVQSTELVGTYYHASVQPDLLTRLGLNVGNPWGNGVLLIFGGLGGGLALALANIFLLSPLIVVWLIVRRMPSAIRWPALLIAIAGLLSWVFAIPSALPGYVLVMTAFGFPYAWVVVAGAVFVAGWIGHHFFARQESAMRATGTALISLYFVAAMYAVIYIEGQLGKI